MSVTIDRKEVGGFVVGFGFSGGKRQYKGKLLKHEEEREKIESWLNDLRSREMKEVRVKDTKTKRVRSSVVLRIDKIESNWEDHVFHFTIFLKELASYHKQEE